MQRLFTITDLTKVIGKPEHIVNYAVKRHGPDPARRVGITRLWTEDQIPAVRASIARTADHRRNGRAKTVNAPGCVV